MEQQTIFLLAGDKCLPEIHLRPPGFTYSACGPLAKNKEIIQKFKETGDSRYIYQNELDKACFQLDRILRDKAFDVTKTPKYEGYQGGLGL